LYTKLHNILGEYTNDRTIELRLNPSPDDTEEDLRKKKEINEEFELFKKAINETPPDQLFLRILQIKEDTIYKILEIYGISKEILAMYSETDNQIWRILNIHNYTFIPKHAFHIRLDRSEDPFIILKERINSDLEMLESSLQELKGTPDEFDTNGLVYLYNTLVEKIKVQRNAPPFILERAQTLIKKIIWGDTPREPPQITIIPNLTPIQTAILRHLGLNAEPPTTDTTIDTDTDTDTDMDAISDESIITQPPALEEDQAPGSLESVSSKSTQPFTNNLCPESFISLDKYTQEEYQEMVSLYVLKTERDSYPKTPSCLTKTELLESIVSDLNEYIRTKGTEDVQIPSTVMSIFTKPRSPSDYTTGFTGKPTPRIFVKVPYPLVETVSVYVTLGSFLRMITEPSGDWFALPLFGGKRRRLGNVAGVYGQSMNHGQVPGFQVYKVYNRTELEGTSTEGDGSLRSSNRPFIVEEDIHDYPLMLIPDNYSHSFISKEIQLIDLVVNTFKYFLKNVNTLLIE
jgi:hypothetical protein